MKLDSIIFGGRIIYNEYDIDLDRPLEEQEFELTEDLVLIEYSENLMLDIGWYPEFSLDGNLIVKVIKNKEWNKPIFEEMVYSNNQLLSAIKSALDVIENI